MKKERTQMLYSLIEKKKGKEHKDDNIFDFYLEYFKLSFHFDPIYPNLCSNNQSQKRKEFRS